MHKESLVVIFTPLQYLNALAFKNQCRYNCEFKIIVLTTNQQNIQQIKKIDNDNITIYPLEKLNFLNQELLWTLKLFYILILKTCNYREIVIGNYNNIIGYFLALKFQKQNKNIYILDDGLATINIYQERNKQNILKSSGLFGGRINLLINNLFYRNKNIKNIIFYSCFDLESIVPAKYDRIIYQENEGFKVNRKLKNEIWFIGSPLVENNLLSEEQFDEYIKKVRSYAEKCDLRFKYILHRFEKSKNGFDCINFELPIELVLRDIDTPPKEVVSFYSSALFNIATFFPMIKVLYINLYRLNNNLTRLIPVYDAFAQHSNLHEFQINSYEDTNNW